MIVYYNKNIINYFIIHIIKKTKMSKIMNFYNDINILFFLTAVNEIFMYIP